MRFTVHGPFKLQKQANGLVDRQNDAKRAFWQNVINKDNFLPSACGCYLYAIRAAKGVKPWYVGMANKQSFETECFASHKVNIYNEVVANRKGTPVLFLLARRTSKGRFAKPSVNGRSDIRFLETLLIATAIEKNPKLMNVQKTKMLRNMEVPGLINSPQARPTRSVALLKDALFR